MSGLTPHVWTGAGPRPHQVLVQRDGLAAAQGRRGGHAADGLLDARAQAPARGGRQALPHVAEEIGKVVNMP